MCVQKWDNFLILFEGCWDIILLEEFSKEISKRFLDKVVIRPNTVELGWINMFSGIISIFSSKGRLVHVPSSTPSVSETVDLVILDILTKPKVYITHSIPQLCKPNPNGYLLRP